MSNTGENIYERRDGRWEGRYICGRKPDGRAQYVSVYGRSCSDVRNKIRERFGRVRRSLRRTALGHPF